MGLDKKTSEPMFEVKNESVFDIELVEKKEFFDYKDNSFFVVDNFKEYTDDVEINKIIDAPLKNYETDEIIKIKNYFIFDYLTPKDLALAIEAVHLNQIEYFELYIVAHNEKSKYKKVKFLNCNSNQICRNDLRDIDISYVVSNGIGRGVMYKDSKATEIYVTKKGEILIYDENDENGNTIPEIQFYKEEG
jgi:hypothetical protein